MNAMMGDPATLQAAVIQCIAEYGTQSAERPARYDPQTCCPPFITERDVNVWMDELDRILFGHSVFR